VDVDLRVDARDQLAHHVDLQAANIVARRAHHAGQVRLRDYVVVDDDELADAKVRQHLNEQRTPAPGAYDGNGESPEDLLPDVPEHQHLAREALVRDVGTRRQAWVKVSRVCRPTTRRDSSRSGSVPGVQITPAMLRLPSTSPATGRPCVMSISAGCV
jgi:hypothetical protein